MSCCNTFLCIYLKNIYIMASGQRRLGTNSLVRSYNNIVEPVYLYIQVNEKSFELKRGSIGWYKKEGDKIGMVWYTMYAWCLRIVCMHG